MASTGPTRSDHKNPKVKNISTGKHLSWQFIGSFFELAQLPNDHRPQIAIAGRSNVGKSSLLNLILGSKKIAKVSSTPGKTRSLNFFLINDQFHYVDLPGYGYAKVAKSIKAQWGKLIEDYLNKVEQLIGLILLLDCRREITREDIQLIEWLSERQLPVLVALTKSDKLSQNKLGAKLARIEKELGCNVIATSAMKGIGKKELADSVRQLVAQNAKP